MSETVIQALEHIVTGHGDRPGMRYKRAGDWQIITWSDYRDSVMRVARGLMALGVEPRDGVVILGFNRPEWFLSQLGAIASAAVPAGIYTTSTAEQCQYIAEHCDAAVAVVENTDYLDKIVEIRRHLAALRAIVLMEGESEVDGVYSWQQLLELAEDTPESELQERIAGLRADDVCSLIYTSGTTGPPKGVMLSHSNVHFIATRLIEIYGVRPGESVISYLALSHIADQIVSLYCPIFAGACTWFAESLEQLGQNLREVRPHLFFAVPRVWEKMQAAVEAAGAQNPWLKRRIAAWARRQGLAGGYAEQNGRPTSGAFALADKLVFSKVRERLGLDRARACITSAAPISLHTLEFFLSLGIPILEVYGMSECTGPGTLSTRTRYRSGKAGWVFPGTEITIADDGEVCMRGAHVFLGYHKNPEATREALDEEGWLHSGDIGQLDDEGFLSITDRKKELIITSGGKNVAPQAIEGKLRAISGVAQAAVIGDRRNYLGALLTLDSELLPSTAKDIGSPAQEPDAAARCPVFRRYLEQEVEKVNQTLASYETVKRFVVLDKDFSVDGGELTPTMKLKRRVINQKYGTQIDELYA